MCCILLLDYIAMHRELYEMGNALGIPGNFVISPEMMLAEALYNSQWYEHSSESIALLLWIHCSPELFDSKFKDHTCVGSILFSLMITIFCTLYFSVCDQS